MSIEIEKQKVSTLIQSRNLAEAKALCGKLCKTSPQNADVWLMLAGINAQLGNMAEVAACCRRVAAIQPDHAMAQYNLGVALQKLGKHDESVDVYRRVVSIQPDYAVAHANLGLALRVMGRLDAALDSCRRALELQPSQAEAKNTLGLVLLDQGRLDDAMANFNELLQSRPDYAEAHYNLGLCHVRCDQPDEAARHFQDALKIKPNYADSLIGLGKIRRQRGELEAAMLDFQQAVRYSPDQVEAHVNLGEILGLQGKADEAIAHYRRAIELKLDCAEAHNNLGMLLMDQEKAFAQYEEIEKCYRQALRHKPDAPQIHLNLGAMYTDMGNLDEALACYRQALDLQPDFPDAVAGLATVLERKGDFQAGYAALSGSIDGGAENINVALSFAALARHLERRSEAAAMLERLVERPMELRVRMDAYFALGKLYDEMKDHAKAFECFRKANALDPAKFDEAGNQAKFDELIASYSPESIARMPRAANRSKLPIFIVGMPRSGTSLVEQILSSHPLVYGAGELSEIRNISSSLPEILKTNLPYPKCMSVLTRKAADFIAQRHLEKLSKFSHQATRVTDKMPHNFLGLGLIDQLFPGARVIHVKRNAMDNCLSIYSQHFNSFHSYSNDLENLGRYYRQYLGLMDHWKKQLRIPMMEVKYEELVADQERISREMIEFCELGWDERCLRFHESKRVVTTLSYDQVRRPMYNKSVARWRPYEPYLEPLAVALGDAAES